MRDRGSEQENWILMSGFCIGKDQNQLLEAEGASQKQEAQEAGLRSPQEERKHRVHTWRAPASFSCKEVG